MKITKRSWKEKLQDVKDFPRIAPIPEKTSTSIATEPIPEATWHREVFGKTILSPSALTLKSSLQSWGKPSVEGWDLLSGPETAAARAYASAAVVLVGSEILAERAPHRVLLRRLRVGLG